jgi:hypothetical protein
MDIQLREGGQQSGFAHSFGKSLWEHFGDRPALALIHRLSVGVMLISIVRLGVVVWRCVGVDDRPIWVSGCSCRFFVSRDGS